MLSDESVGLWLQKARALDRYRWQRLQLRHGRWGGAIRFWRDALLDTAYGLAARLRLSKPADVVAQPCDLVLLQSQKVIAMQRKRALKDLLRARGHRLSEVCLHDPEEIIAKRLLLHPGQIVPLRYWLYAAHAEWLVASHEPQVLMNDRTGSLYAPFLRLALNRRGALLVQLAHATTLEKSSRLGMNDYDYHFLFGESSLRALQARSLRFGTATMVLAGSHLIDTAYDLPPADIGSRRLLVLGVGPDKEKEAPYQAAYALLSDWARQHPQYQLQIKLHPRSRGAFWKEAAARLDNVTLVEASLSLAEALQPTAVVINLVSNAVIEAALARRPILNLAIQGHRDFFELSRFFGPPAADAEQLSSQLARIEQAPESSLEQAAAFACHHLAHGFAGLEHTVELLERLLAGQGCNGVALAPAQPGCC